MTECRKSRLALETSARTRICRLLVWFGLGLTLPGCGRCGTEPSKGTRLLESKMKAAMFSPPASQELLRYRLYVPIGIQGRVPLIVWLHGTGGRGKDNVRQLASDLEVLVSDRVQKTGPTFVLAPQCPEGDKWANRYATFPLQPYDLASLPESEPSRLTVALVRELIKTYPVDATRIYVMGFSMGGSGTWDMLMRHPDLFAAGVPITGVADIGRANLLAAMPIWSFHGELDPISPVRNGRMMYEALKKVGAPAHYTEIGGVEHDSVGLALKEPDLFRWLFAQRRPQDAGGSK
jgi:predicted peptidase